MTNAQVEAHQIIGQAFQWLSLLGSLAIIAIYLIYKNQRSLGLLLIVMIAISDMIFTVVNLVHYTMRLINPEYSQQKENISCQISGFLQIYSQQSIFFNGGIFVFTLYRTMYQHQIVSNKQIATYYILSTIYSLVCASVPLLEGAIEPVWYLQGIVCFLGRGKKISTFYSILFFFIPWAMLFVCEMILVVMVSKRFQAVTMDIITRRQHKFLVFYLISFPTILIFCWSFLIINIFLYNFSTDNAGVESYLRDTGIYLQSVCFLEGFLSFLQFIWFKAYMKRQLDAQKFSCDVSSEQRHHSFYLRGTESQSIDEQQLAWRKRSELEIKSDALFNSVFMTKSIHNVVNMASNYGPRMSSKGPQNLTITNQNQTRQQQNTQNLLQNAQQITQNQGPKPLATHSAEFAHSHQTIPEDSYEYMTIDGATNENKGSKGSGGTLQQKQSSSQESSQNSDLVYQPSHLDSPFSSGVQQIVIKAIKFGQNKDSSINFIENSSDIKEEDSNK